MAKTAVGSLKFFIVMRNGTTIRGCEVKGLLWADVDLLHDTLTIRKSKTAAGERIIPLTRAAFEILVQLRKRSELFGAVEPEHHVFASFKPVARFNRNEIVERRLSQFDPTKPLKCWRTAWRKLTAKAGLPGLRFHDLRHHAITELLTNPKVSVQTAKAIAGHVSQRMVDRYAHIRLDDKRSALDAVSDSSIVINRDINTAMGQSPLTITG